MRNLLLAVDGGGTSTQFCVSDRSGMILHTVTTGPVSHKAAGKSLAKKNLADGLQQLKAVGITSGDIALGIWGLSGCDTRADRELQETMIRGLGFDPDQYLLCNDSIPAFYAQATEPGIVLIAGTGSIAVGIDHTGRCRRAGGWGYGLSDFGAGQWIGNELLKETLLYCDGCRDFEPVFDVVREKAGSDDFDSLCYAIAGISSQSEVAGFAPLVFACQDTGICQTIVSRAAEDLASLGTGLYQKMRPDTSEDFIIVLAGGIFQNTGFCELVAQKLCNRTGVPHHQISPLTASPVEGGIRLAVMLADQPKEREKKKLLFSQLEGVEHGRKQNC